MGALTGCSVEAESPEQACRLAAAQRLETTLPEVDRDFEKKQLEVIVVLKGEPDFAEVKGLPRFPAF